MTRRRAIKNLLEKVGRIFHEYQQGPLFFTKPPGIREGVWDSSSSSFVLSDAYFLSRRCLHSGRDREKVGKSRESQNAWGISPFGIAALGQKRFSFPSSFFFLILFFLLISRRVLAILISHLLPSDFNFYFRF